jgi:tetratricopeptide (TPR) repeat protein
MFGTTKRIGRILLSLTVFWLTVGLVPVRVFGQSDFLSKSLARYTNPQIPVEIEHPPAIAIPIERVAFAPATGPCADEFMSHVQQLFFNQGIEVLDRNTLDMIMKEHNLALGDYGNAETMAAMGEILGPSALVKVNLHRCDTTPQVLYERTSRGVVLISRTTAVVKGVVQVVDVRSTKIAGSRTIDRTVQRENKSTSGYPEHPSEYEVLDETMAEAAEDVHHLFFPWTERRTVVFYNDDRCGLKQAFRYLKIGDFETAFELSEQNLKECEAGAGKPKNVAHAHYNLGLMHAIFSRHDEAIDELEQALLMRRSSAIEETLATVRQDKALIEESRAKQKMIELAAASSAERNIREHEALEEKQARKAEETSVEVQLEKLKSLLDKGLISREVYDDQSAEILRRSLEKDRN